MWMSQTCYSIAIPAICAMHDTASCPPVPPHVPSSETPSSKSPLPNQSGLPPPNGPEVAFAGRSNAGKSSAINTLANHTGLAFVSKTPAAPS